MGVKKAKPDPVTMSRLQGLPRKDLIQLLERNREAQNEWIKRMVIQNHRVDILAEMVLGYQVCNHHRRLIMHQYRNRHSLTLIWRGAGKTTIGTVAWSIFQVILDRDRRILLASKTADNSKDFLKEIKTHFETNERLKEIFGEFVGQNRWDNSAIEVCGRTKPWKEPTINTVGVEGAVASKHYDMINADDLVDEENSRTKHQREKMLNWYYKNLIPTLEPPVAHDPFIGSLNVIGTRYHYEDLYGHLLKGQPDGTGGEMMGDKTLIIPVVDDHGNPTWPERYTRETIDQLRSMGIIRFNSQYKCDCDAMKGQIFRYDDCEVVDETDIPDDLRIYHGVDLAISVDEGADMFAQVIIGKTPDGTTYVLDYMEEHLRFPEQTAAIKAWIRKWKPIRTGIESNAYQAAQYQQLKHEDDNLNVVPIYTLKDKVTRAWNLAGELFENNKIRFKRQHQHMIEHLVLFPSYRYKDLFDALDIANTCSKVRKRRRREKEPGVIGGRLLPRRRIA